MANDIKAANTTNGDQTTSIMAMLGGSSKRLSKILAINYMGRQLWNLGKSEYTKMRARIAYTLTVDGSDVIYSDIHTWLLTMLPPTRQHALRVETSESYQSKGSEDGDVPVASGETSPSYRTVGLRFLYDGTTEQEIVVQGHKIKVAVVSEKNLKTDRPWYRIVFTCYGVAARDVMTGELSKIAAARSVITERLPRLYLATRWGDWDRRDELAARPADSVVLRAGVMENLIDDLGQFLAAEARYLALSMPFHRGYLFYGPPGTGKSSVARALASHFGLDLYYMPLGDLESDADLTRLISRVPKRSVLLLEDIDTFGIARKRDEGAADEHSTGGSMDPGASLSGLLNVLDGIATPHGLIVMMTTNQRGVLDDALVRDFRINVDQLIDYLDEDQLDRLITRYLGLEPPLGVLNQAARITAAQVLGIVFRNLDDPIEAVCQINELCSAPAPY